MVQPTQASEQLFDALVIGSGFGGAFAAHQLIESGYRVLMLERGDWVQRSEQCWSPRGSFDLTPYYSNESPYRIISGGNAPAMGSCYAVGGPSVFYGAVSLRFREEDFDRRPEISDDPAAAWPLDYADLEPYYVRAEQLLGTAGESGADPTEPPRSGPYPHPPSPLSDLSRRIGDAAESLGLHPFRLPLAINYSAADGRNACIECRTCDTFACAIEAKNDIATRILPALIQRGLVLRPQTVVTALERDGSKIRRVRAFDVARNAKVSYRARQVIVAAGAMETPRLLLESKLHQQNPAGRAVGRYLMRHCNAIAFGVFPHKVDPHRRFHKQLGIHDYYLGHPSVPEPVGKLGSIQQLHTPPVELMKHYLPAGVGAIVAPAIEHLTGLLVMAEDQPCHGNHVRLSHDACDMYGMSQLEVVHQHTRRDLLARKALLRAARRVMRRAGAWITYMHKISTFSHAVGTVRMGAIEEHSPVDAAGRFRGIDNLSITDASVFPTAGGVNPSLTIGANALRIGEHIAERLA